MTINDFIEHATALCNATEPSFELYKSVAERIRNDGWIFDIKKVVGMLERNETEHPTAWFMYYAFTSENDEWAFDIEFAISHLTMYS